MPFLALNAVTEAPISNLFYIQRQIVELVLDLLLMGDIFKFKAHLQKDISITTG
jgi:hypothetical protein